ncbi:MAG: hypothetical protein J6R99_04340 [Alphaproteobacteria bacterium]|nr:hypothetical protein [Alphaproteobacteria bacterium]
MWVKKPDMSTMTKSHLEDIIKKWHPKINGARIIAFALTLLSLGLGVKSCRDDKEIGEKNAKIATLEGNFNKLSEEHQTIMSYAEEAAKVCGLVEENKLLNDSIDTLNDSIKALNAANAELNKKLKKCQQSKKEITVQKDTVYLPLPKGAEPENKLKIKVHVERKIEWVHVNSR